jgi:hypothetical protein
MRSSFLDFITIPLCSMSHHLQHYIPLFLLNLIGSPRHIALPKHKHSLETDLQERSRLRQAYIRNVDENSMKATCS